EQLTEHYFWTIEIGNGGHLVGYYSELPERIPSEFLFPLGKFTLKIKNERFFLWSYQSLDKLNYNDTFKNNL
ncbi:MAG: hypothetical protein AABX05_02520, partial [Nanoarchaeota archaeon]